jgi:tetratricopeptide (TPR) repeat protein
VDFLLLYERFPDLEKTSALVTINNLATLYINQGRLVEAEAMFKRALAGREKTIGPTHADTLMTVGNLSVLYRDQGRLVEAEAMFKRTLVGVEKVFGPDHTLTRRTVNNLANLYRHQPGLHELREITGERLPKSKL